MGSVLHSISPHIPNLQVSIANAPDVYICGKINIMPATRAKEARKTNHSMLAHLACAAPEKRKDCGFNLLRLFPRNFHGRFQSRDDELADNLPLALAGAGGRKQKVSGSAISE